MAKPLYPTFGIQNLDANKLSDEMFNVDHFSIYLSKNPHLKVVHKHTFYHLVFFTKGSGSHTIDFESFPVEEGMIYFMRPGQVHQWNFKGETDGYIINFSPSFFNRYLYADDIAGRFSFFNGHAPDQVIMLGGARCREAAALFEAILKEKATMLAQSPLMIASLLLQLFVTIQRSIEKPQTGHAKLNHNTTLLHHFQSLIEQHFLEWKLPKDYAAPLHMTPAQLNAICKQQLDLSAGELIRNRIILEAKRLLVNFDLSISFIALELNFPDASYFVKFFKKYVGSTPEVFRKQQLQGH